MVYCSSIFQATAFEKVFIFFDEKQLQEERDILISGGIQQTSSDTAVVSRLLCHTRQIIFHELAQRFLPFPGVVQQNMAKMFLVWKRFSKTSLNNQASSYTHNEFMRFKIKIDIYILRVCVCLSLEKLEKERKNQKKNAITFWPIILQDFHCKCIHVQQKSSKLIIKSKNKY